MIRLSIWKKALIPPLLFCAFITVFQDNPLSRGVFAAFGGAQALTVNFQMRISSLTKKYLFLLSLREENQKLKKQKAELSLRQQLFQELQSENSRFREMLDFPPREDLRLLPAQVIARDFLSQNSLIVINKGSVHGVKKRMGVLRPEGAVGYVFRAGPRSSQVITLFNRLSSLPALNQRSRIGGLIERGGKSSLLFKHFGLEGWRESALAEGDKIVTARSDQFPPGLPIGAISSAPESASLKMGDVSAAVRPHISFSILEEVFVVMSLNQESKEIKPGRIK